MSGRESGSTHLALALRFRKPSRGNEPSLHAVDPAYTCSKSTTFVRTETRDPGLCAQLAHEVRHDRTNGSKSPNWMARRTASRERRVPVYRAEWRGQISTFPPVGTAPPAMPVRYSSRHPLFTGRHPLASQSTCPVAVVACCAEAGAATAVVLPPKTASKIIAFVAKKRLNIASSCRGLTVLIRCHLGLQGKRGQDVTAAARIKAMKPSAHPLAEGVGFEPTVPLRARRFSRPVP